MDEPSQSEPRAKPKRRARPPQFEAMLADDSVQQKHIRGKMIRGALFVLMFLAAAFYQVLTSK